MWDTIRDVARRAAAIVGTVMNAAGVVLFLAPLDVRADYAAAAIVATGTAALWWALRDRDGQIEAKDAALDDRANIAAALQEFRARLDEGNELFRTLPPVLHPKGVQPPSEDDSEAWAKAIGDWNTACRETVDTHLTHRAPVMDAPVKRTEPIAHPRLVAWAHALREEVEQKIDRMIVLQGELGQSRRAAIS